MRGRRPHTHVRNYQKRYKQMQFLARERFSGTTLQERCSRCRHGQGAQQARSAATGARRTFGPVRRETRAEAHARNTRTGMERCSGSICHENTESSHGAFDR